LAARAQADYAGRNKDSNLAKSTVGGVKMISRNEDLPVQPYRAGLTFRVPAHNSQVLKVEEWTYQPGLPVATHSHSVEQITYVAKGKLRLRQAGEEAVLEAGSFYYTPPGVEHEIVEVLETTVQVIFSPAGDGHSHAHDHQAQAHSHE
jgi:quercetin dioxygenase-like cupin family protein